MRSTSMRPLVTSAAAFALAVALVVGLEIGLGMGLAAGLGVGRGVGHVDGMTGGLVGPVPDRIAGDAGSTPPVSVASAVAWRPVEGAPLGPLTDTLASRIHLPTLLRDHRPDPPDWPDPALAERIWRAAERLEAAHLGPEVFPGDAPEAGGPSAANVDLNLDAACHDFRFPEGADDPFGEQAHHRACYAWVAANRGLWHAARARRALAAGSVITDTRVAADLDWAGHYLDDLLDTVTPFVYGPEDLPEGQLSYRDTLAAIWQNNWRAVDILLLADLLRQAGALSDRQAARSLELAGSIARAWRAHYRSDEPALPNSGRPFTTSAFPDAVVLSPGGRQVASRFSWTFEWDADAGNSQSEETSWMGAGALMVGQAFAKRLPDAAALRAEGKRWVDYSLVYDRLNPRDGSRVRSLNAETEGGAYGQRRYWVENHTADVPSIPYAGYSWMGIGVGLLASDAGPQMAWDSLAPDDAQWRVMLGAAGESLRGPDGRLLVRFEPHIDYAMEAWPAWTTDCGRYQNGTHYMRYSGPDPLAPKFVSEIGHPAGLDIMNMAWPILLMAEQRGDADSYWTWRDRLDAVLRDYTESPPDPAWTRCRVAPYVSGNPGYHVPRMLSSYLLAWLAASGYAVEAW